jgi:O-methyltransferase
VERMYALWQAARHTAGIRGDVVECGVWRGGSSMLMATVICAGRDDRRTLWLYDTFEGMPLPSRDDIDYSGKSALDDWERIVAEDGNVLARAGLLEVQTNLASTGIELDRVRFIQGKVEDTIPTQVPAEICLLRLDTDWYESTAHELEHLWERLTPGGVILIDDYGHWRGCRRAVDEFFAGRHDAPLLNRIDYTGRIGVKS